MSLVAIQNIKKSHGEKVLFEDISFSIEKGDRIGLIGVNGTGKSTVLKVVAGVESPDAGEIITGNGISIEYLPQNPSFDENQTVLQAVFLGSSPVLRMLGDYEQVLEELSQNSADATLQTQLADLSQRLNEQNAWELEADAKNILNRLGITNYKQNVRELSGGQRKRVALARALIRPSDVLLLDEPTNHIDHETVEWLENYLAKSKTALLLITHDRYFLDRVVNRTLELDKGNLYSYSGNYENFLELKAEREERELASEDKRQNLLRRELAWLRRGAKARTTKQKARVEFAEALRDQQVVKPTAKLEISLGSHRLGNKVIELEQVSKKYGNRTLIDKLTYLIGPRDRIGIVGPNGSGKSTLLEMIAGKIAPDSGTIEIGPTVKLAYYTQESVDINENQRVIEYIKEVAPYIRTTDGSTLSAGQMLELFLFPSAVQWTPISKLSGGEKRRLYLLRLLMSQPNVLLLDEPTNDLDIQTLTILEDYLDHFQGTVITVSHDRYFLDRVVDRLIAFEKGQGIHFFLGMYSEYRAQLDEKSEPAEITPKEMPKRLESEAPLRTTSEKPRKFSYKEQKEFEGIEERIAQMEDAIQKVQTELHQGGSDYTRLQELMDEQSRLQEELSALVERWAELSELAEDIARNKGEI